MTGRVRATLSRVKGRSITELRVRGGQAARAWLERHHLADDGEPNDDAFWARLAPGIRRALPVGDAPGLLERFRARTDNPFFSGFADRGATTTLLQARWPAATSKALSGAEAIRSGAFDLLGHRRLSFGSPIDWHLDPLAQRRAPLVHWSRVPYLDVEVVGDHKVVWELNRHQYFVTLGRAYWLSGEERYAQEIAAHLSAWMSANPPKLGINWSSSLEVAMRAISWVWALHLIRESRALTPELHRRVLAFLDIHARHLASYLSTYFSPNTHLTGEALGLYIVGTCLPELSASARCRALGRRVLQEQLPLQIRADGVYVEQSPYYQRYTADFYLHALALADASGDSFGVEVEQRLEAAVDHMMHLMRPDNTWPQIGDDDGGQLLQLDDRAPNDFRATLALAAVRYERADFAAAAGVAAEEILWIAGPDGLKRFDALVPSFPAPVSRAFRHGGTYIMRDGWEPTANYAIIDAGVHGFLNCGHAHADALSLEIALRGVPLLIDSGTYSYTADRAARDHFRSTVAHNTVTIDGHSSSEPGTTAFSWTSMAHTVSHDWLVGERFDYFRGSHDGFQRLAAPATHERSVFFVKGGYWLLRDRIVADAPHVITIHFHFPTGVCPQLENSMAVTLRREHSEVPIARLSSFADGGSFELSAERMSPEYGRLSDSFTCRFVAELQGGQEVVSILTDGATDTQWVSNIGSMSGPSFEIMSEHAIDQLSLGPTTGQVTSDAAWTWVRRCRRTSVVTELVLLDASRCEVDGMPVTRLDERVTFVEARLTNEGWLVRKGTVVGSGR